MTAWLRLLGLESGADVHRIVQSSWQVTHDLPGWVFYMLLSLGLVLAAVNLLPQIAMRTSVRVWTFVLRLAAALLLLVVLAGVEWHLALELNEKQQWTVLLDDSASMATEDVEGRTRFAAALDDLEKIRQAVGDKVELTIRTFSGHPPGSEAGQGPTRFQDAVGRAALSRGQLDRIVILTDGRDSERRDLRLLGEDLRARGTRPSIRLYGSAQPPVDTGIAAEPDRSVIRLGEELVIRGSLSGSATSAERMVRLQENGTDVKSFQVPPDAGGRFEVRHKPTRKGRHTYTLQLAGHDAVAQNDRVSFTVDVIEEKINVLLLEGYPRFEFKILKSVLEVDPLVNLVSVCHLPGGGVYVQGEALHRNPEQGLLTSQADLFKYDVVILRDLSRGYFREGGDTTESRLQNIVQFVTKRGGGLVVLGGQDVYRAGGYQDSQLVEILPFDLSDAIAPQAQFEGLFFASIPKPAYEHPILSLLPDPGANRERLNSLRQLDGANNVGRFKPLATPLMTRTVKIKDAAGKETEKEAPILAYMAVGEGKVLAAAVDTLWRWQLQPDFDDPPLAALMANVVRYLAPPPGRKPEAPNVGLGNGSPQVGQELMLSTVLRDSNFDPLRNAELQITVTAPDGTATLMYPRDLPEDPGVYEYRVFIDQPGPYKVVAKHAKQESTREFLAGAAAGEFADLSVDREAAATLCTAGGGEVIDDLKHWLSSADTQPARKPAIRDLEVWNSPLVLVLFLLLISADCYIRKRQGLA